MKLAVVLNGISLGKDVFYSKYLPLIERELEVEVFETRSINDAILIGAKTVQKHFDIVISAGGDGTINQVLNGIFVDHSPPTRLPVMAILPLGSGNDFARSLDLDNSPVGFVDRLKKFHTREIDVGEVFFSVSPPQMGISSMQERRYFLNVFDVGMGPPVVRGVLESGRAFGSAVAYYQSIVKTFFSYKPLMLHAKGDDWEWHSEMRSLAIGNAKYFGNGLCIAPDAEMDDGLFDVFACGAVSVLDFILQSVPLKKGKKIKHPQVSYFKSKKIELSSPSAVEIETDGEIIGWLPAKVGFSPYKLSILV